MNEVSRSFQFAVLELVGSLPIKQRLTNGFSRYLEEISGDTLPVEVRNRFLELRRRLTCVEGLRGESAVVATIRKMSNDEASDCARQVVDILAALNQGPAATASRKTPALVQRYVPEARGINRA